MGRSEGRYVCVCVCVLEIKKWKLSTIMQVDNMLLSPPTFIASEFSVNGRIKQLSLSFFFLFPLGASNYPQ